MSQKYFYILHFINLPISMIFGRIKRSRIFDHQLIFFGDPKWRSNNSNQQINFHCCQYIIPIELEQLSKINLLNPASVISRGWFL